MFAVARVHLASAAAATRLGRAAATAPRHAVAPQVRAAVDARNVEQRDAFQRRTAAQVQRAAVTLYNRAVVDGRLRPRFAVFTDEHDLVGTGLGRRSLWDRGTCPPIFMKGDIHGNVPQYFRSDVV